MNSIRQASRSAPLRKKHEAKKLKRKLKIDLNNLDVDITISKENNAYVVIVWHLLKDVQEINNSLFFYEDQVASVKSKGMYHHPESSTDIEDVSSSDDSDSDDD